MNNSILSQQSLLDTFNVFCTLYLNYPVDFRLASHQFHGSGIRHALVWIAVFRKIVQQNVGHGQSSRRLVMSACFWGEFMDVVDPADDWMIWSFAGP